MFSVCRFVSVTSFFFCVCERGLLRHLFATILLPIFYVDFDVTQTRGESARGTARGDTNCLSYTPSEKMNKTGICGCGSFVVADFQPATSINRLQLLVVVAVAAALVFLSALRKKNFQGLELTVLME